MVENFCKTLLLPKLGDGSGQFSSTDFELERFSAHGHSEFFNNSNFLSSIGVGPFNVEGVLANNRARLEYFAQNPHDLPYVHLALCRNSILMSQEALHAHCIGLQDAFVNNYRPPVAVAWVADGAVEGFDLMASAYIRNFALVGIPMRLFRDHAQAEIWLMSILQSSGT